jgi:polyribonucleotide nucleotidyltransferase
VDIASVDELSAKYALEIIQEITAEPEVGKVYLGRVAKVMESYTFVEILPGVDGMLHISEIADFHVRDIRKFVNEGDDVLVKILSIDSMNRIKLSRKAVMGSEERPPGDDTDRKSGYRGDRGRGGPYRGDRRSGPRGDNRGGPRGDNRGGPRGDNRGGNRRPR